MKPDIQESQSSFITEDSHISHIDRNYFKNVSFFSKQFCLPKEIKLNQDRQGIKSMQNGLQIVVREDIDDINPRNRDVEDSTVRQLRQDGSDHIRFVNADGLISMFKYRIDLPIRAKVAICVTVYSEDKQMLKNTLDGIKLNYKHFLQKAGILSHQIIVVVIFDGIQKMNSSPDSQKNMVSIFRDFDLMNGFRKKDYILAKNKQPNQQQKQMDYEDNQKFRLENYDDDLIFTEDELDQLEDVIFQTQYNRYMEMCELVKYVKQLSKKDIQKLSISEMPKKIRIFFLQRARKFMAQHHINNVTEDDDQLQKYLQDNMARQKLQMLKFQSIKWAEKVAKDYIQSRQSTAILYQMAIPIEKNPNQISEQQQNQQNDPNLRFHQIDPKMYTFFAVKHQNSGKLSSHLWFFQGFCNIMRPDVCVLIDCGLRTSQDAIFKMWAHIQTYKNSCGGVCGYMSLNLQNPCDELGYRTDQFDENKMDCLTKISNVLFDIQRAQMFEYHFAHMLDKPFQSWFGYIHVLPGAFSAYNWRALEHEKIKDKLKSGGRISQKQIKKKLKQRILRKYLKTVIYNQTLQDIKQANMYLAEDRILCLQIYSKKDHHFNLQYLPDAQSTVDPVTSLIRMLGQRKRWINGSWFALQYVLENRKRVNQSDHNNWDKFKFRSNMFYSAFNKALSYVGISLFFIILHFMIQQFAQNQFLAQIQSSLDIKTQQQLNQAKVFYSFFSLRSLVNSLVGLVDFFYILAIGVSIYYSLTLEKHTQQSKRIFNFIASIFGIYGVLSVVLVFYNFFSTVISKANGTYQVLDSFLQNSGVLNVDLFMYLLGIIVIVHLIVVIATFDLKKYYQILISLPSYFFYVPSYIHILFIYAFCRIDDLSWGTKGLQADKKLKQSYIAQKFKNQKLRFVFRWVAVNVSLSITCISISNHKTIQTGLIWAIAFYVIIVLLLRFVFAMIYLIKYHLVIKRKVQNTTLSRQKRINRVKQGRKIKQNLAQYIQEAKNYQLDEHINEINEQLNNQSKVNRLINQQQYNLVDIYPKSIILDTSSNNKTQNQNMPNSNQDIDKSPKNGLHNFAEQDFLQTRSVQKKKKGKKQTNLKKKKIFAKAGDNVPILAQIFNTIPQGDQSIQFEDIVKLSQLQKVKQKVRRYKHTQINSKIASIRQVSQQINQDDQQLLTQQNTKNMISTKPQLDEQQKYETKGKVSINQTSFM